MKLLPRLIPMIAVLSAISEAHQGHHPTLDEKTLLVRTTKAKRCASEIGAMKQKRHLMRKRAEAVGRRDIRPGVDDINTDFIIHSEAPKYDFIKNDSCILTPEVSQGPYWFPSSETLRTDITEDQVGVPLHLDIGVIDVNTCEPMRDVLISIWHCNSTGSYSSFEGNDPNTPFLDLVHERNITDLSSAEKIAEALHTSRSTWLRGMWPTDAHGATEFRTIFPGFYIERTIHIHAQVHTNWNITSNGTVGHSRVVETGQIFFDEKLSEEIMSVPPYADHTEIPRYHNDIDGIFLQESQTGAMTIVDTEPLDGYDYKKGVLGYITLAVDPSEIRNGTSVPGTGIQPELAMTTSGGDVFGVKTTSTVTPSL